MAFSTLILFTTSFSINKITKELHLSWVTDDSKPVFIRFSFGKSQTRDMAAWWCPRWWHELPVPSASSAYLYAQHTTYMHTKMLDVLLSYGFQYISPAQQKCSRFFSVHKHMHIVSYLLLFVFSLTYVYITSFSVSHSLANNTICFSNNSHKSLYLNSTCLEIWDGTIMW